MTFDKKIAQLKSCCSIYLNLLGLIRVDIHNICGNFRWKRPSTKTVLRGTQQVIAPQGTV